MSRKRVVLAAAVGVLLVAALTGYYLLRQTKKQVTARIGYLNIVASLPLFIADEKGFLPADVRCELMPIASSNQLVDGLAAGTLDFFPESSAVPALAVELQSPGRMKVFSISHITREAPFDSLIVKESAPLRQLADLADKKIAVYPGSTATNLLKKFLADRGVDTAGIQFVAMPPQNHIPALTSGSVDAVHAYEPTTAIALTQGGMRRLFGSVYAEMLSPNPQGVAAVRTGFLKDHPQESARIIAAMERAMVFMRENEAETRRILVKRLRLSEEATKQCVFLYMVPHREIDASVLQRYADMLTDLSRNAKRFAQLPRQCR